MPTEVEARFLARDTDVFRRLRSAGRLGPATLGPAAAVDEVDRYVDTPDGRLAAARWACRLRRRDARGVVSLKGPPQRAAGAAWLHRRPEVEGPGDGADPENWPASEARTMVERLADGARLEERLVLRQHRVERPVTLDGAPLGTLSLDDVLVERDGAFVDRLLVVEVEVTRGADPAGLTGVAASLEAMQGLEPDPRTKLEHALAARARRLGAVDVLPAAAGLATFGYLGWDGALWDPRFQLLLHLLGIGVALSLVVLGLRGTLPRSRIELPLLGLLAAYAIATASATNPGVSLRAFASVVAVAVALPAAMVAIRWRPMLTAAVVAVPILGLAAGALTGFVVRRVEWYLAGAPGILPPLRLGNEGTPFGSVAIPPFALLALVPLALLPAMRPWRTPMLVAIALLGAPLAVLSGSRSAWLAIGVTAIVLIAPSAWRRRAALRVPKRWTLRSLLVTALIGAGAILALALALPRLTAFTSLIYRGNLWRDTLAAWSADPILGVGPGLMPWARQAAAEPLGFPIRQPHSHNLPLGVLGDAGFVGLLAALALVATFVWLAGPWRSRTAAGRAAGAALAGIAIAQLFEDLTFMPSMNLLVVFLAAIALTDAEAVAWRPIQAPRVAWRRAALVAPAAAVGVVVVLAMVVGDAAAIAYRHGTDAAERRDWDEATRWLSRAVALDPWHPAGPKSLTVVAAAAGDHELARAAAARAVALAPGDGASWTNLALLCLAAGDRACAAAAADEAVARATFFGLELVNAAHVYEALGDSEAADRAFLLSLLVNPLTGLGVDWPRPVNPDEPVRELGAQAAELNLLLARVDQGRPVDQAAITDPAVRALAYAIAGDGTSALDTAEESTTHQPDSALAWDLAIVIRRAYGEDFDREVRVGRVVRGAGLPAPGVAEGPPGLVYDIATFRTYPRTGLIPGAEELRAATPYPWTLARLIPGGETRD